MAFKKTPSLPSVPESPADFFRTFTRRTFPDVMPHQRDMLRDYGNNMVGKRDVALQLPTGSGKTLVGLLIAEWRRRKFEERVVYLCPTKQLVNQTVEQAQEKYGIDVNGFTAPSVAIQQRRKPTTQRVQRWLSLPIVACSTYLRFSTSQTLSSSTMSMLPRTISLKCGR